ncbi:hypothetical protein VDIAB_110170 [Vibrio diabolicus]|nr:hypothetical protein VDIAB_110170 [Vibrio diabolicus]
MKSFGYTMLYSLFIYTFKQGSLHGSQKNPAYTTYSSYSDRIIGRGCDRGCLSL